MIESKDKYLKPFNSVHKSNSDSFKNIIYKIIYLIYMYKHDLALNNCCIAEMKVRITLVV